MMMTRTLKEEYAIKRARAFAERDARVEELYKKLPKLKKLSDARRSLILERGRAALSGGETEAFEREEKRLDAARAALLKENGVSESEFLVQFECPLCEDTGFVGNDIKAPCDCLKKRDAEARFSRANLTEGDRFELFREDIYPNELQYKRSRKLREICESYADSFPNNGVKGMILCGASGLGKTFLLRCIAHRVLERGYSVADLSAYGLMRDVMARIQSREGAEDYSLCELLIIDDLGSEPAYGGITVQTLFSILNERQNLNKPTLFATNLTPKQILDQYGERLYSRIFAPRYTSAYNLVGEDLRTPPAPL